MDGLMALNSYILNGPSVVIEDDARDWEVSWQNHLDRTRFDLGGPRGGVDLVAQTPLAVRAPTPGTMYWSDLGDGAGKSCRFRHDLNPGWADVFSHLSSYVGYDGQHFNQGDIIAYTGNTGGVVAHLHRHLLDPAGVRRNPIYYFAGGTGDPGTGDPGGFVISIADGKTLQEVAAKGGYGGVHDGVPGTNTWLGIQNLLTTMALYSGPVDGDPGQKTWEGVQLLARKGGYAGVIDGIPGPNTYAGLRTWLANGTPTGLTAVYGIDVGTTQRDLNFQAMRDAGYQFAIVKAGGSNVPLYTAPHYQQQVSRARAAGMLVGHYWMAGSTTPANDANYFVDHLFDYRPGDLLALDNEAIDDGIFWNDALTATFMQTVKNRLGKAPFLYTYSHLLTANTWTQTKAVGSKLWVAHYTETPGNPTIGSAFPAWEIHQYTQSGSQGQIPLVLDAAKLTAFAGLTQPPLGATAPPATAIPGASSPASVSLTIEQGKTLQRLAARGGYGGVIDGIPGVNTWLGAQEELRELGYYNGPVDGVPGDNTYRGLQLLAADNGYDGPVDGVPGTYTFNAIQFYLDATAGGAQPVTNEQGTIVQRIAKAGGYAGVVDGVPGTNTWKGMQQVLAGYGYSGPVDGAMGTNSWAAFQRLAAKGGYTGVADGVMGTNSWKGIQTVLTGFGYGGPIDGAMGTNSYMALQRLARIGGYLGPIDGVMGTNSWKGVQTLLSGCGYTGPIDGAPGVNTYKAMQTLAYRGGYRGPNDGIPGVMTYEGLRGLLL
jgi:GH25 family lysozyme M1 (1,4-beta-N-acetylmuramidase)